VRFLEEQVISSVTWPISMSGGVALAMVLEIFRSSLKAKSLVFGVILLRSAKVCSGAAPKMFASGANLMTIRSADTNFSLAQAEVILGTYA